ncbi:NAD(P)-binding protein [Parathielavia hyrcaniae]|uniref:NAD(P)-binding protein n=1 Tax=Parathielavia hyrcaniae TaxID=113614 RepID=A0AAN6Q8L3_9PEZI|nr:NAD(P)-binding protein [Parathielavia hyrcaniae]
MFKLFAVAVHFFQRQLRSIPVPTTSYAGRTVIVTGANGGLGLESARHFARLGAARVILACRSTERGEAAKADIERTLTTSSTTVLEVWPLDLCDYASVREFCRRADRELDRLDVLLANAAMLTMGSPQMVDGWEMQVFVNVLANFLMVFLLLPLMRRTAAKWNVEPVVTVVSSEAHILTKFVEQDEPRILESFRPGRAMHDRYGTTKLLDVLLVQELAERLDAANAGVSSIVVNTANPGLCESRLFRDIHTVAQALLSVAKFFFGRTSEEGSRALMAAVAAGRASHGKYVDSGKVDDQSPFARSEKGKEVQKKVWDELVTTLCWQADVEPCIDPNVTRIAG